LASFISAVQPIGRIGVWKSGLLGVSVDNVDKPSVAHIPDYRIIVGLAAYTGILGNYIKQPAIKKSATGSLLLHQ